MRFAAKLIKKGHLYKTVGLIVLDVLLYSTTDARRVASVFLVTGFGLLLLTIYYLIYDLQALGRLYGFRTRHRKRLAISLTGMIGALIALQTVGELSPHDALVILPLGLLAYLYTSYGANKPDQLL